MRAAALKKRLIVEAAVALAALVVAGGLYGGAALLDESMQKDRTKAEGELNGVRAQANELQQKFDKAGQYYADYVKLQARMEQPGIGLDRQKLKQLLDALQERDRLVNLKVVVAPVQERKEAAYKKTSVVTEASDVSLEFGTVSDEEVVALLDSLNTEIPGRAALTKLSLAHDQALSKDTLAAVAQSGRVSLIKASVAFNWLGIKQAPPPAVPGAPNAPATPAAPPAGAKP